MKIKTLKPKTTVLFGVKPLKSREIMAVIATTSTKIANRVSKNKTKTPAFFFFDLSISEIEKSTKTKTAKRMIFRIINKFLSFIILLLPLNKRKTKYTASVIIASGENMRARTGVILPVISG